MVGYLIGDGYVGGKTPVSVHQRAGAAAGRCSPASRPSSAVGHPQQRAAGRRSRSRTARARRTALLRSAAAGPESGARCVGEEASRRCSSRRDVAADVVANLLFGLLESDGCVGARAERCGPGRLHNHVRAVGAPDPLAAARWGIGSVGARLDPTSQRASLIDGRRVRASAVLGGPDLGHRQRLTFAEVDSRPGGHAVRCWSQPAVDPQWPGRRGSQQVYLSAEQSPSPCWRTWTAEASQRSTRRA